MADEQEQPEPTKRASRRRDPKVTQVTLLLDRENYQELRRRPLRPSATAAGSFFFGMRPYYKYAQRSATGARHRGQSGIAVRLIIGVKSGEIHGFHPSDSC
jgi:hypothetical protein